MRCSAHRALLLPALLVVFVASACRDFATAPAPESVAPSLRVGDAQLGGGNAHFFWLPPLGPAPQPAGTFDPMLDAVVSICEWDGTTCVGGPLVTFSRHTGTGSEILRVELGDEQYIVNWHAGRYDVDPAKLYRISVAVGSTVLGHADVRVKGKGRGETLPITFRIEEGALPAGERAPVLLGFFHACFLASGGEAWCSGNDFFGQLGTGSAGSFTAAPVRAAAAHVFEELAIGLWHTCGRKSDGSVWCWGYAGAKATGPTPPPSGVAQVTPIQVAGVPAAARLTAGYEHTCVLTVAGEAWCWGANFQGQLGRGFTSMPGEGTPARAGTAVYEELGAGFLDTCGRTATGEIQCWGYNVWGQHGDDTFLRHTSPSPALGTHASLAVGAGVVCSLDGEGAARCWGNNASGALGRGFTGGTGRTPQPVLTSLRFRRIAPGTSHTCAIATPGDAAYCWGSRFGLGTGSLVSTNAPTVPVVGGYAWSAISVNDDATCGVTTDGAALCWGNNTSGELGTGSIVFNTPTPTPVAGGHVIAIE